MEWVRGDFLMSDVALNRFFALHVVALPIVLLGLVFVHFVALHHVGSNNPDGIEIKKNKDENGVPVDGIPSFPYTVHDVDATVRFPVCFLCGCLFCSRNGGLLYRKPNFEVANPLKTPDHIAPVWYYTPYYAMLRAATFPLFGMDAKFWGLVTMGAVRVIIPAALPWLDRSPVKSMRYKGWLSKSRWRIFAVSFIILGVLGVCSPQKRTYNDPRAVMHHPVLRVFRSNALVHSC